MFAVISPAKKLDFSEPVRGITTQPQLIDETEVLLDETRRLLPSDLSKLMKISDQLAELNYGRFQSFELPFTEDNAKQAIFTFNGDTYVGFDAKTLDDEGLDFAQDHVGILSGLYGLLRPRDLMQPYRLEMGTRLQNPRGKDLYAFWGDRITTAINCALEGHAEPVLVNLASNEYFKSVKKKELRAEVVTPVFRELKDGKTKVIGLMAKRARGMMARYIVEKRIESPKALKKFKEGGYRYVAAESTDTEWVFIR